jgi:hypothetical protein
MTPDTLPPTEPVVRLFWSSPHYGPGEALATLLAQRWQLVGGVVLGGTGRVVWVAAVPGRGPGRAAA